MITAKQLRKAANLKEKIAVLENQLASLLGGKTSPAQAAKLVKKRKMSAAGRAAIRAAQKARWAKVKAAKK